MLEGASGRRQDKTIMMRWTGVIFSGDKTADCPSSGKQTITAMYTDEREPVIIVDTQTYTSRDHTCHLWQAVRFSICRILNRQCSEQEQKLI